jgi:hypothetical protein
MRTVRCDVCGKEWTVNVPPRPTRKGEALYINGKNEIWLCTEHAKGFYSFEQLKAENNF